MMEVKKKGKENLKNNFVSKQGKQSKKDISDIMGLGIENTENILSELDRKINAMQKIIKIQEEQLENNIKYLKKLEEQKEEVNK